MFIRLQESMCTTSWHGNYGTPSPNGSQNRNTQVCVYVDLVFVIDCQQLGVARCETRLSYNPCSNRDWGFKIYMYASLESISVVLEKNVLIECNFLCDISLPH